MSVVPTLTMNDVRRGVRHHPSLSHVPELEVDYFCRLSAGWDRTVRVNDVAFSPKILKRIGAKYGTKCVICHYISRRCSGKLHDFNEAESDPIERFFRPSGVEYVGPFTCSFCYHDILRFSKYKENEGLPLDHVIFLWLAKVVTGKRSKVFKRIVRA